MSSFYAYVFQFHKGTIKTFGKPLVDNLIINFNSIKVQLKLNAVF